MVFKEIQTGERVNKAASDGQKLRMMNKVISKCLWFKPKYVIENDENNVLEEVPSANKNQTNSKSSKKLFNKQSNPNNFNTQIVTVIFIPSTHRSNLQKLLQTNDDNFTRAHNIPRAKFIERGGTKIIDLIGTKDPWKA